jgi:hypothetical protein
VDRTILVEAARGLGLAHAGCDPCGTALATGCDLFLTNDGRLKLPPGFAKEMLQ